MMLVQVTPASAFMSSETSRGRGFQPDSSSMRAVAGNESGMMTVSPMARTLAAQGSSGAASRSRKSRNGAVSSQARLTRIVCRLRYTAAHNYRDIVGRARAVDVGQAIGLCRLP